MVAVPPAVEPPVTVTVCAVEKLEDANVRVAGSNVALLALLLEIVTVAPVFFRMAF